jgi:hypothetical protein
MTGPKTGSRSPGLYLPSIGFFVEPLGEFGWLPLSLFGLVPSHRFSAEGFGLRGTWMRCLVLKGVHYMGFRRLSVDRARNYYTFTTLPF